MIRFGSVREITAVDYVQEVNKAGEDIFVVLHLYRQVHEGIRQPWTSRLKELSCNTDDDQFMGQKYDKSKKRGPPKNRKRSMIFSESCSLVRKCVLPKVDDKQHS